MGQTHLFIKGLFLLQTRGAPGLAKSSSSKRLHHRRPSQSYAPSTTQTQASPACATLVIPAAVGASLAELRSVLRPAGNRLFPRRGGSAS